MRQNLLKSLMVLFLLVGTSAIAVAQTVYGVRTYYDGTLYMESFELNDINAGAAATPATVQAVANSGCNEFTSGAAIGNKYYGIYANDDYEPVLATFNFETGKIVKIKKYADTENLRFSGMASNDGKLYGLRLNFDDEGNSKVEFVEVNVATGEYTVVTTFNDYTDVSADAIASDGKGGFYWIHNTSGDDWKLRSTLLHISADYTVTTVNKWDEIPIQYVYDNSLVPLADGTLLYCAGTDVYVIDPTTKTMTLKGTLEKALKGLTLTKSSEDGEGAAGSGDEEEKPKNMRKLVRTTSYGNHMGTTTDATKQIVYFYDGKLNPVRVMTMGRDNAQNEFSPSYYTKYNYNEAGILTSTQNMQYGLYDLGDASTQERESHNYTYNEQGKLIKDEWIWSGQPYRTTTYTYDEDGNKESEEYTDKGNTFKTSYYGYDNNGNATTIVDENPWNSNVINRQYDDNGNLIAALTSVQTADPEFGDPTITPTVREEWTYDETGFLTEYTKYNFNETAEDGWTPSVKIFYEAVDGNRDIVKSETKTYFTGNWYGNSTYVIDEYQDFTDMDEATGTELTVSDVEGKLNTAELKFRLPYIAMMQNTMIDVYRDGEKIYSSTPIDGGFELEEGAENYYLKYTDEFVTNGSHDYFVQTGVAAYSEWDEFDLDENVPTAEYKYYCVSNVVNKEFNTELPAVTALNVAGAEKKHFHDPMNGAEYDATVATLVWTNPENRDAYGFISNSVYAEGMNLPENATEDIEAASLEVPVTSDMTVYVCTRYKLGKAKSETITLKVKDLEEIATGIKTVSANGIGMQLNGKVLNINGNANVSVFSLGGKLAVKANNAASVDLSNLANGVYVITVEKDGVLNSYKVVLK